MNSIGWDLLSLFEERVERQGQKPLYSFLSRDGEVGETLTFAQLHAQAAGLAGSRAVWRGRGSSGTLRSGQEGGAAQCHCL